MMRILPLLLCIVLLGPAPALPQDKPSEPDEETVGVAEKGLASFYGRRFHGRRTASGETFDAKTLVAAHPRHAFGTLLRVTNVENGKTVEVRVVDRGPARGPRREGVIIDLSPAAARILDFVEEGRIPVRVSILSLPEPDDIDP